MTEPNFDWTSAALITLCCVLFFLSAERLISVVFCPISAGHLGGKANPIAAAWNAALQIGQRKPTEFNWWAAGSRKPATTRGWPAVVVIVLAVGQLGCGIGIALRPNTPALPPLPDAARPFLTEVMGNKSAEKSAASANVDQTAFVLVDQRLHETRIEHTLKPIFCDEFLVLSGHRTSDQVSALVQARGCVAEPEQVNLSTIQSDLLATDASDIDLVASPTDSMVATTEETTESTYFAHCQLDDPTQSPITVCWTRTWYAPQSQTTLASARSEFIQKLEPSLDAKRL